MQYRNGSLAARIGSGVSRSQFLKDLKDALQSQQASDTSMQASSQDLNQTQASNGNRSNPEDSSLNQPNTPAVGTVGSGSAEGHQSSSESSPTSARTSNTRTQRTSGTEYVYPQEPPSAAQQNHVEKQKRIQEKARAERERVRQIVENNKRDRKEKESPRSPPPQEESQRTKGIPGHHQSRRPQTGDSKECALKVRLLDGSTILGRFPPDNTIQQHVRPWIEGERSDGDLPYTFRQIQAPLPNRQITISEESESLESLGLMPTATMVTVPVRSFTAAYSEQPGIVSKGLNAGYGIISGGIGLASNFLNYVRNTQGPSNSNEPSQPGTEDEIRGQRVRTLNNRQPPSEDQQLYNGNQVSTESEILAELN